MSKKSFDKKVVEMRGITKKFGDFTANKNIDFTLHKGEVHSLLGENGAGKSTLMNVLYGLHEPTEGSILINGKEVNITNPSVAIEHGIGMVHQHFMLVQNFTVVENIMLGMETVKGLGVVDKEAGKKKVIELSEQYGLYVNPDEKIEDISVGMQQRVEILKALYRGADILILDEPTSVLTPQEIHELMEIIKNLANQGKSIIIITHKLREIKQVADHCTVIRRGENVGTVNVEESSEEDLASLMVGREVSFKTYRKEQASGEKILDIKNLIVKDNRKLNAVDGLNLELNKGEILGIAGIDGNGQSELIDALTGLRKVESGTITLNGKDITNASPKDIINTGMSNIPEDRQKRGLVLPFTIGENMILENHGEEPFSTKGKLNHKNIKDHAKDLIEKFDIRPNNPDYVAGSLSGGNQQKVILAREIYNDPDVLIAAQPTRGLDVGAIEFIHEYLVEQRDKGKAVLLISFELDEIMNLSDRIAVIFDGKILDTVKGGSVDENQLGLLMAGGKQNE